MKFLKQSRDRKGAGSPSVGKQPLKSGGDVRQLPAQQSRARQQAGSPCAGKQPLKSGGDMRQLPAQQSRARQQAGSPSVGKQPLKSGGDMRRHDTGRSLTVAALMGESQQAVPGLPAYPTGPRAYFITFSCYGAWVHGDAGGSVDREHNVFSTPVIKPNPARESAERVRMRQSGHELDRAQRYRIVQAIHEVCAHRGWWLFAIHVRTTHVHVIVQAGDPPEKVMSDFKVYSSRRLNETALNQSSHRWWARHGSTRYLWKQDDLEGAIRYVLHEQGEPMATYAAPGVTRQRPAQQSRDREGAGSPSVGSKPPESAGDMRQLPAQQSRDREGAGSPSVGSKPPESAGDMRQLPAQQSRDRKGAGSPSVGSKPPKSAGDMRQLPTQQSRARQQAGSPSVGKQPLKSGGDMRRHDTGRSLTVAALRGQSAFTMMEIAISLAVIGIALVAIIGVLPIGMNAQQDNRQQTVIGQDSSVFIEGIRNGSLGGYDLTNYVYAITNYWTQYGPVARNSQIIGQKVNVNGYTYSSASVANGYPGSPVAFPLTNNANIIGLMSTPEYIGASGDSGGDAPGQPIPSLFYGGISNHVVAYVYSISGSAAEKPPQNNPIMVQDSFSYRIYCVNAPMPIQTNEFTFAPVWSPSGSYSSPATVFWDWTYWQLPAGSNPGAIPPNQSSVWQKVTDFTLTMIPNTHELRLTFEWPQLGNGDLGSGRQTYRTLIAGQLLNQPSVNPASVPPYPGIPWNTNLYVYQSQTFTNAP